MQHEHHYPSLLASYLADVHVEAWRDYIARSGESLEVLSTPRDSHVCVEVVCYESGELRQHVHFAR